MNHLIRCLLVLILASILPGCKKALPVPIVPVAASSDQTSDTLLTSQLAADSVNITPFMEIFTAAANTSAPPDSAMLAGKWTKCDEFIAPGFFNQQGITWFRLTIANTSYSPFKKLLCFRDLERVELDYFSEKPEKAGELTNRQQWSYPSNSHCLYLLVNSNQTKTFYIRCYKEGAPGIVPLRFIVRSEQNEQSVQAAEIKSNITDMAFLFFYLGFLSFCFIYFLSQYLFRSKERILIVYVLYILFTFLYSLRDADKHYFLKNAFPVFNGLNSSGEVVFSYLSYLFYLWFVIYLLNLKKTRIWAYRLLITVSIIIGLLLLFDALLRVLDNADLAVQVFIKARMLLFPLVVAYFLLLMPLRRGYYKYFLLGSICLLAGAGLNLLVFQIRKYPSFIFHDALISTYGFWGNTVNYTRLGVMGEIIFFSLGLSKRMQADYTRAVLLNLNSNYTSIIFHEIRNSLNKLAGMIKNHSPEGLHFIGKMGDMLTDSLEINEIKINLKDELDIAQRYFYFRLKSNQTINLEICNPHQVDLHHIGIPTMLLQPFIDNCFKHAFTSDPQQAFKKIEIYILRNNNLVNIEIKDNGVGLKEAINKQKSKGNTLINDRLYFYNSIFGSNIYFETANRTEGPGTVVTIYNLQ